MAVCPAATLSVKQVAQLGGNVEDAILIQFICALLAIVTTPLLLIIFNKLLRFDLEIKYYLVFAQIALTQFIPMVLGSMLRKFFHTYSWLAKRMMNVASWFLISCFVFIIFINISHFSEFKWHEYAMLAFASMSAFLLGVVLAGNDQKNQITFSLETALRNFGLVYLIANANFESEKVATAIVPFITITSPVVIIAAHY